MKKLFFSIPKVMFSSLLKQLNRNYKQLTGFGARSKWSILVIFAFAKVAFQTQIAYRLAYWITLINMFIRMFAVGAIWDILVRSRPDAVPVERGLMVTYGMLAVVIAQLLTWWNGPHMYMVERVREGTITFDLRLPIYFPVQIFARSLGDGLAKLLGFALPGYVAGLVFWDLQLPTSISSALLFLCSLSLSYILMFEFNFLLGLISFFTFRLVGIQHAYHGIVTLLSGMVVPIWLFPNFIRPIVEVLPFSGLFNIPISIYIGKLSYMNILFNLIHQLFYTLTLSIAIFIFWRKTYRNIVIQGG